MAHPSSSHLEDNIGQGSGSMELQPLASGSGATGMALNVPQDHRQHQTRRQGHAAHGQRPVVGQRCSSFVEWDHFDPSGVKQLRQTLSTVSAESRRTDGSPDLNEEQRSVDSEATLGVGENFDFEKTLRAYFRR